MLGTAQALGMVLAVSASLWGQGGPDPLDQLNAAFRADYAQAKARQLAGTIILVDGDRVVLMRGQTPVAQATIRPPLYHRLKAVDHVALALYLRLDALGEAPYSPEARVSLRGLGTLLQAACAGLGQSFAQGAVLERQQRILGRSRQLLEDALKKGRGARPALAAFAKEQTPWLMANARDAAVLQLDALDRAVSLWRRELAPAEWLGVRVVLIGAHMAREGEVTWQYFARLLGQPVEGDRIIYAEGRWEVKDALDLLATHGVDQGLGAAFFGNPARMHRDVLADAAKAWLDTRFKVRQP